jgi:hypothetical protein
MSNVSIDQGIGRSLLRWLKELYLSVFVVLFRFSGWKGRIKAGLGSVAVSVVMAFLLLSFWAWLQVEIHQLIKLNRWILLALILPLALLNDNYLIVRGHGLEFEKRFHSFRRTKRIILYSLATSIILLTVVAFFVSIETYHRMFGIG